jgi:hypothetical protein
MKNRDIPVSDGFVYQISTNSFVYQISTNEFVYER